MSNNELEIILKMRDEATKKLKTSLGGIDSQVTNSTRKMASLGQSLRKHWLGATIALGGMIAVGRGLASIINLAIEFESAFAGVRKTVDATEKEFKQLSEGIRDMSKRIPVAATNLAQIQEIAGQLGIRGVNNLTKFTEAVAKIAVTTNLTQETAAIGFARIAAVIGEDISNIEQMANVVVDLGNKFEVMETEILTFAQRIAGMGKVVGLTSGDILAIGAAFASVGIQAEAGGTAVNKVLLQLQKEGKRGRGAFLEFVANLEKAGDKAAVILEDLGFKQARTQRAFLSLAGAGGKLTRAFDVMNNAQNEANALNIEAAKRFGTTASQIQLTKNNVSDLGIEIGQYAIPAINNWLGGVRILVKEIELLGKKASAAMLAVKLLLDPASMAALLPSAEALPGIEGKGIADSIVGDTAAAEEKISAFVTQALTKYETLISNLKDMWAAYHDEKTANELANLQRETEFYKLAIDTQMKAAQSMWVAIGKLKDTFTSGLSSALVGIAKGAQTAQEAFAALGWNMVQILVDFMLQKIINFALSKAMSAAEIATATATGAAVAAAWAPAAANVAIATLGGAVGPASAALGTVHALAAALSIPKLEDGGIIRGSSSGRLIIAGENNKDEAIIPLTKGMPGGTTYINVEINNPSIRSDSDIDDLVEAVSRQLAYETDRIR